MQIRVSNVSFPKDDIHGLSGTEQTRLSRGIAGV